MFGATLMNNYLPTNKFMHLHKLRLLWLLKINLIELTILQLNECYSN